MNNEFKKDNYNIACTSLFGFFFLPRPLVTVSSESCFVNGHVRTKTHSRRQIQNANYEIIIQQYVNNGERAERHARGAYHRRKTQRSLSLSLPLSVSLQR